MVGITEQAAALARTWPPQHPHLIQLYAQPSPNGVKVMAMLAECGITHEFHRIEFGGPKGGATVLLAESNAILLYLAEKTGRFLPDDEALRLEILQWLFWQASSLGPTFGQIGYFKRFEGREINDPRPLAKFADEAKRLLGQLEARMTDREWLMGGGYSIADIAVLPLIRNLIGFYDAGNLVGFGSFSFVNNWLERWLDRPAVASLFQDAS